MEQGEAVEEVLVEFQQAQQERQTQEVEVEVHGLDHLQQVELVVQES